jgi:hypothetical protein
MRTVGSHAGDVGAGTCRCLIEREPSRQNGYLPLNVLELQIETDDNIKKDGCEDIEQQIGASANTHETRSPCREIGVEYGNDGDCHECHQDQSL